MNSFPVIFTQADITVIPFCRGWYTGHLLPSLLVKDMLVALNAGHLVLAMGAKYARGTSDTVILIPWGNKSVHGVG